MPKLTWDGREIETETGRTLLEAATAAGVEIPTLCFQAGLPPGASCMLCVVKDLGRGRLVPACAVPIEDGMRVESKTEEVSLARRKALELLLSDHAGECLAPCERVCPLHVNVPEMLQHVVAGEPAEAAALLATSSPLPRTLARLCHAPCEKGCRRKPLDEAPAVKLLERFTADAAATPGTLLSSLSAVKKSGRRVAVVGAGPAGLAAAHQLLLNGHACTVFDRRGHAGGSLRRDQTCAATKDEAKDRETPPPEILAADLAEMEKAGIEFRLNTEVGAEADPANGNGTENNTPPSLANLRKDFDAVLLAGSAILPAVAPAPAAGTLTTTTPGVFTTGGLLRRDNRLVRVLAGGRAAAVAVARYLRGEKPTGPTKPFSLTTGKTSREELVRLAKCSSTAPRARPAAGAKGGDGFTEEEARAEAARCFQCGCRAAADCRLRRYAAEYGADPRLYRRDRREDELRREHPEVVGEPGKCIACGLCIRIAEKNGEPHAPTFVGRGFGVRVSGPFGMSLLEALGSSAAECAAACPTAALRLKRRSGD